MTSEGRQGPVAEFEIPDFIRDGKISPETLVWRQGFTGWTPAAKLPELESRFLEDTDSVEVPKGPEVSEIDLMLIPRPGRRIAARFFDIVCWITVLTLMLKLTLPDQGVLFAWIFSPYFNFGAFFLFAFVESAFLSRLGCTPGKLLLGMKVEDAQGRHPGLSAATLRSFSVLIRGMAFGIPLFMPVTLYFLFRDWRSTGLAHWDRMTGLRVRHLPLPEWRSLIYVALVVGMVMSWGALFDPAMLSERLQQATGTTPTH